MTHRKKEKVETAISTLNKTNTLKQVLVKLQKQNYEKKSKPVRQWFVPSIP